MLNVRLPALMRLTAAMVAASIGALVGVVASAVAYQSPEPFLLPTQEAVIQAIRGLDLRAQPFSVGRGDWDDSAGFTVPDEQDVVTQTLVMYAATLTSEVEARDFYVSRARQLELDNEVTHAWNTPRADVSGANESRDFRIIYVDVASRSRSAEYARLMRRGSVVSLVEVVGSPTIDDEGLIDEERHSILVVVSQLVLTRMTDQPQPSPTVAELSLRSSPGL
jgi:hypothetical protein